MGCGGGVVVCGVGGYAHLHHNCNSLQQPCDDLVQLSIFITSCLNISLYLGVHVCVFICIYLLICLHISTLSESVSPSV